MGCSFLCFPVIGNTALDNNYSTKLYVIACICIGKLCNWRVKKIDEFSEKNMYIYVCILYLKFDTILSYASDNPLP